MMDALKKAMMDRKGKNIMLTIKLNGEDDMDMDKEAREENLAPPSEEESGEGHSTDMLTAVKEEAVEPMEGEDQKKSDIMAMLKEALKNDFEGAKGLRAKAKEQLMKY